MAVTISVYVEEITAQLAAGYESIKLYRDTEPDGAFSTLVDTETLVALTTIYDITDANGTVDHWYRYGLWDGSALTALSEAFQPNGHTLLAVIAAGARRCNAGFASECTSVGTTTTLIDLALVDNGVAPDFLEGSFILRPSASAGDRLRRVATEGFNTTAGALSINASNPWTTEPAEGEEYYIFRLLPPIGMPGAGFSWQEAAAEALRGIYYDDQVDIGTGTSTGQARFSLAQYRLREEDIGAVYLRTTNDDGIITDIDAGKLGRYWEKIENGPNDWSLELHPPPKTTEHVIVEIVRHYEPMHKLTDVTLCDLELAARATAFRVYRYLNRIQAGKYVYEMNMAAQELAEVYGGRQDTVNA